MNEQMKMLFIDNPEIEDAIERFCVQDPEYLKLKKEFYEAAEEIRKIVGFDLYDRFERRFALYLGHSNDIYYLFGLGLRQEVLDALS